jgi:hypothetical protein
MVCGALSGSGKEATCTNFSKEEISGHVLFNNQYSAASDVRLLA